uniref:von Willebrand factor C domain-containing protein 2-like n=2 Tax=Eukaryota TaxID=2759 RepID=A0A8B8DJL7_CRAVI|nr:von Willebrand factor C domain-containing protein 2-like [Crassostrea virginica]|mmetsp:Transcript_31119/g.49860  ORF Transcript_31119/g.49860 Transcript_31119/m.49860 type:complete len:140 (+) Transcript_31119:49-468(+)
MGLVGLFVLISLIFESGAVPLESGGTAYEAETGNDQYQTKTCLYDGTVYPKGSFKPSLCKECICSENGDVQCTDIECFIYPCVDKVHKPGDCCPMCPNGQNCKAPDGTVIRFGEEYVMSENVVCVCDKDQWGELEALCK